MGEAAIQHCRSYALEAERKMGEMLKATQRAKRGRAKKNRYPEGTEIPPLADDERAQLEANIRAEGCRDAIIVWNGIILDGHNRFEICERLNIPYETKDIKLDDRLDAKLWIRKNQLARRNLTDDQRAMNAVGIIELETEKAKRDRAKREGRRVERQRQNKKKNACWPMRPASEKLLRILPEKQRRRKRASPKGKSVREGHASGKARAGGTGW